MRAASRGAMPTLVWACAPDRLPLRSEDQSPHERYNRTVEQKPTNPRKQRPLRWALCSLAGLAAMLLLCYGLLAYAFYSNPPRLTRNFAAELNKPILAIPPAERAWPKYREVLKDFRELPSEYWGSDEYIESDSRPEDEQRAWRDLNRNVIPKIRAASKFPRLGFVVRDGTDADEIGVSPSGTVKFGFEPSSPNPQIMMVRLEHIAVLDDFVKFLEDDLRRSARDANGTEALEDVVAIVNIADQLREGPLLVSQAASWRVFRNSAASLGRVLAEHPGLWDQRQLERLSDRFASYAGGARLRLDFSGERMMFKDVIQRIYTDDGQGDGYLYIPAMEEVLGSDIDPQDRLFAPFAMLRSSLARRRELTEEHDRHCDDLERLCRAPLWKVDWLAIQLVEGRLAQDERLRLADLLAPSAMPAYFVAERTTQERDAALVSLALVGYRLRHGTWPKKLADLSPDLLTRIPADRFTGTPLKYRLIEGNPVVYSVGEDLIDDGGLPIPAPESPQQKNAPIGEGDWILWPPMESAVTASQ